MIFENTGITRRFFFDMQFLEKARLINDPTRSMMNGINVEYEGDKVFLIATNGRFMNFVEYNKNDAPEMDEGFYNVKKCVKDIIILEKEDGVNFPNWRNVIPTKNILVVENITILGEGKKDNYFFYDLIYILNNLGCFLLHDYLKSMTILDVNWDIYLNPYKINSVVMFKNHTAHILSSGNYTTVIAGITNKLHTVISDALALLDKTLQSVNDKEGDLFVPSIHKNKKPLFEL
jgi:hypothetical protein